MDVGKPPKNIYEAAQRGDTAYIKKVAERTIEFNINARDTLQRTALHWAAELGHTRAAEMLIDYGVDIKAVECNGRTAAHLAARSADRGMLEVIMDMLSEADKEALANQVDNFGLTPLFLARQKDKEGQAAFEYLLLCGGRMSEEVKK